MFAQLGDVDVHRAGVEVVVVNPDCLESVVALKDFVDVGTQQTQKLRLFGGELGNFVVNHQHLLLGVEGEAADFIHCHFLPFLTFNAAQDGFDAEHQLFHRERFCYIVVGSDLETF